MDHIPDRKDLLSLSYDEFLERLKMELGSFFSRAERGKTNAYQGLRSRRDSMRIRDLLKVYRKISIRQEKRIKQITRESKKKINEQLSLED